MTPREYASAFCGEATGTLRRLIAPRTGLLPPTNTKAQINPGLSLSLDEKWRSRQVRQLSLLRLAMR
jgi:hypothetical protein